MRVASNRRTAGPCSWMKSARCRDLLNPDCAFSKTCACAGWVAVKFRWTCRCWPHDSQPVETHLRDDIFYRQVSFKSCCLRFTSASKRYSVDRTGHDSCDESEKWHQGDWDRRRSAQSIQQYPWPGNARELRNVVERATIVTGAGTIRIEHLPSGRSGPKLTVQSVGQPQSIAPVLVGD